ncbi:metacaspase-1 [Citrus sinensis]|uniref:Metacaspase-1 n=1 Tax=Citrus sinensis TaxID=2711 RepID=A0ACB8IL49_CITSI|nr:metacaspase-1 [Citrus sinensis]
MQICPRGNFGCNIMKKIRNDEISPNKRSLNTKPFSLSSSSSRPSRRAVLCGVSYNKGKFRLKGTINDVRNMRDLLINSFKFQEEGIIVLTEEEKDEMYSPTKKNIQKALEWLVNDCRKGDSLVFYFSGHGLRQPDFNNDETDGFDETICPVDFLKEGMIIDNDINSIIVKPLKEGVTLHAIVDACHSGTILDLEMTWEDNRPPSGARKATDGGLAICLSACQDNQLASDTSAFTGNTMNGVMTYVLAEIVNKHPGLSYGDLLDLIYERIEEVKKNDCLVNTNFLRRFFKDKLSQKPTLSSSGRFEVYKKHFIL